MPLERPIPAFYCCYLLRSTVRHSAVYVGSTPNPVRRLRQHNGLARGGAVRTSKDSLRPWEMTCLVTGFPSHIAALQFEWAWQNPHITTHIPTAVRITTTTATKKSGQPRRPRHSTASLISNLHLLLSVPSFARWPLQLRFFNQDVYKAWVKWCRSAKALPDTLVVRRDFNESESTTGGGHVGELARVAVDYEPQKEHVSKARSIVEFEREGQCAVCNVELAPQAGVFAICPNAACEAVSHLTCLSTHFLKGEDATPSDGAEPIIPIQGSCPRCKASLRWSDVVRETTLRLRGEKEVQELLRVKKKRSKTKEKEIGPYIRDSEEEEEEDEDEEEDDVVAEESERKQLLGELRRLRQLDDDHYTPNQTRTTTGATPGADAATTLAMDLESMGDSWYMTNDEDEEIYQPDLEAVKSKTKRKAKETETGRGKETARSNDAAKRKEKGKSPRSALVIPDTDEEDVGSASSEVEILDLR